MLPNLFECVPPLFGSLIKLETNLSEFLVLALKLMDWLH